MGGLLLVNIVQLTGRHRAMIDAAATARGWTVRFCDDRETALQWAGEAEIIFGPDAALLDAAGKLRWLCVPSAGAEQYLKPVLADRQGVWLSNSSGAYGVTIAEHIVMVTLEMMRRQPDYNRVVAKRGWVRTLPVASIRGSRITLLGTGDIGREAAIRLRSFGPARVTGINRRGRLPGDMFDDVRTIARLDEILPETDLLICSLPNTPDTRGLLDDRRLGLLPGSAYIVNVGRGSLIDEAALEARLRAGRLAGAALDVFETEPLPPESTLWDCPRLLITPHVAGNMTLPYTVDRIVEMFIEDFGRYCEGQPPLRQVRPEQGY